MSKEPVGSVAQEAAKLFAVLQQAAADARGADHSADPTPDTGEADPAEAAAQEESGEHDHGTARSGGPECQWCPICQLVSRVRHTSPEAVEQLATTAAGVLGSVRSLLEAAAESARQARADAEARTADQGRRKDTGRPARSGVDRIDVSEDPEPWD
ncbi:MAG TPA: hypothetical protein VFT31_15205 [Kribbella sp.]|nr:hypothetical protein [Kribbella sp.]